MSPEVIPGFLPFQAIYDNVVEVDEEIVGQKKYLVIHQLCKFSHLGTLQL